MLWRGAMAMWAVLALAGPARAADRATYILDWLPSGEETAPWIAETEGLFSRGLRDIAVVGPLLEDEAAATHAGFWG